MIKVWYRDAKGMLHMKIMRAWQLNELRHKGYWIKKVRKVKT